MSWRGGELDRLLDEDHARLVGAAVRRLVATGWEIAVEATYSWYGERGSIDVFGGRRSEQALAVIEVKSDLTVIEQTARKTDEKVRIARRFLGRERFGFTPRIVGRMLVLPSTTSARSRVARSADVLDVAFPVRGTEIRHWLRHPVADVAGILFVPDSNPSNRTAILPGRKRIRRRPTPDG